uniref:Fibroblast growth factor n=1 Tax=Equus caballus TaxID=9796 RepID=F7C680_HORSE
RRGPAGARPADAVPAVATGSRALQLGEAAVPRAAAAETPSPNPSGSPRRGRRRAAAERREAGGPRARPRAAGREAGGPGPGPRPGAGRRPGPGPGGGGSPRGSRGSGAPAGPRRGHGSREHHHAARPARGRRQRRLPARPLQGPQAALLQKRGLLPAHPPRRPSGRGPGEERPSQGNWKPKDLFLSPCDLFMRLTWASLHSGWISRAEVPREQAPMFKLQLQAEERGVVSIKGVCANRYLAMKEDGRLLASKCVTDECFFFERLESNNYNTYRSRKYSSWYVALKRTGQYKLGPKTGPGQKAILFLPMSAKS